MAAVKQAVNDAIAQLPRESSAGSQTPAASPAAASMTGLRGPEPADEAASKELSAPATQTAAVTREEAVAIDQVRQAPVYMQLSALPVGAYPEMICDQTMQQWH